MTVVPNLGLGYLAATLLKNGFETELFHCGKLNMRAGDLAAALSAGKYDIVGIQSLSFFYDESIRIARRVKSRMPSSLAVIGGPHVSGMREAAFAEENPFDYGFAGEAETGFAEFVKQVAGGALSPEDIPGLIWRDAGRGRCNDIGIVRDIDTLPMPAWELMDPRSYPHQAHGMFPPAFPVAPVIFSRGCNYNCDFCATRAISGAGVRYRSVANLMLEIEYLYNEFHISAFAFLDQNFTADGEAVAKLCRAISGSGMNIKWYCPNGVHLDSLTDELLGMMRAAGCTSLTVGIESASEKSLKALNRVVDSADARGKIGLIKKHHISVTGNFIIGLPDETLEDFRNTIRSSLALPLDRAQFAFFVPFPGTVVFRTFFPSMEKGGVPWSAFDVTQPFFADKVSPVTAWFTVLRAFFLFYIRPRVLFKNAADVKSFGHLRFILSRIATITTAAAKSLLYGTN